MRKLLLSVWLSILLVSFLLGVTVQHSLVGASNPSVTKANTQKTYWIKTYGGKGNESITAVKTLSNGDIIAVGHTYSSRGYLAFVIKLTPNGDVIWTKAFGGEGLNETATSLAVAPNGDVVVAGAVWSSNGVGMLVIRLSPNGSVRWQRIYRSVSNLNALIPKRLLNGSVVWRENHGSNVMDFATAVAVAPNGDVVVVGERVAIGESNFKALLNAIVLKLSPNGDIIWYRRYNRGSFYYPFKSPLPVPLRFYLEYTCYASAVTVTPKGDIVVVGYSGKGVPGRVNDDVWVLKLSPNGSTIWQKTYGGPKIDRARGVALSSNGDIVVVGYTDSFGAGKDDAWVLKLDPNGNIIWQKAYGGPNDDEAYSVALAPSGDIIVAGSTASFGADVPNVTHAWVLRLDEDGNVRWQKAYGGSGYDWVDGVALASDGSVIVAGGTYSFGAGNADAWILKLPSNGSIKWRYSKTTNATETTTNCSTGQPITFNVTDSNASVQRYIAKVSTQFSVSRGRYWAKTYGDSKFEAIMDAKVLSNGDIIAVGYTNSSGAGGYDVLVMKLSPNGSVIWAKTYGGRKNDKAEAVALTSNGDIIVGGVTSSFGTGSSSTSVLWVLKLDSNGNVIWQKTFRLENYFLKKYHSVISKHGGLDACSIGSIAVASNGDVVVTGVDFYFGVWILKLTPGGNVIWQRLYWGNNAVASSVTVTPSGDIIATGTIVFSYSTVGVETSDVWVLKLDPNGNVIWQKTYCGPEKDRAKAVALASNGDIVVAGYTDSFGAGKDDAWVLKLSPNGSVVWQRAYGGRNYDEATGVVLTPSNDMIIGGTTYSFGAGKDDAWVLKLDPKGSLLWQKAYGGSGYDWVDGVVLVPDGSVIVAGGTYSFGVGNADAWILKLPPNGSIKWRYSKTTNATETTTNCSVGEAFMKVIPINAPVRKWNFEVTTQFHYTASVSSTSTATTSTAHITSTSRVSTTSSTPSTSSSHTSPTSPTSGKKKGICGPAALVALALIPLLMKRKRR